jgi:hypothetical protein
MQTFAFILIFLSSIIIYKTFTGLDKELHGKHMGSPPIIYKTFTGFDKQLHDKHMGSPPIIYKTFTGFDKQLHKMFAFDI